MPGKSWEFFSELPTKDLPTYLFDIYVVKTLYLYTSTWDFYRQFYVEILALVCNLKV